MIESDTLHIYITRSWNELSLFSLLLETEYILQNIFIIESQFQKPYI